MPGAPATGVGGDASADRFGAGLRHELHIDDSASSEWGSGIDRSARLGQLAAAPWLAPAPPTAAAVDAAVAELSTLCASLPRIAAAVYDSTRTRSAELREAAATAERVRVRARAGAHHVDRSSCGLSGGASCLPRAFSPSLTPLCPRSGRRRWRRDRSASRS